MKKLYQKIYHENLIKTDENVKITIELYKFLIELNIIQRKKNKIKLKTNFDLKLSKKNIKMI